MTFLVLLSLTSVAQPSHTRDYSAFIVERLRATLYGPIRFYKVSFANANKFYKSYFQLFATTTNHNGDIKNRAIMSSRFL